MSRSPCHSAGPDSPEVSMASPHGRRVHLVGSLPRSVAPDAASGVRWALHHAGAAELDALPSEHYVDGGFINQGYVGDLNAHVSATNIEGRGTTPS